MDEFEVLQKDMKEIKGMLSLLIGSDRYTVQKDLELFDGRNIQVASGTGTKIGTETAQKLGFYNATPVNQPDTVSDPAGQTNDLDSEARTAINAIIDRLQELGLIA